MSSWLLDILRHEFVGKCFFLGLVMPRSRHAGRTAAIAISVSLGTLGIAAAGAILAIQLAQSGRELFTEEEWESFLDERGRITSYEGLLKAIAASRGVQASLRAQVWPRILGVVPPRADTEEQARITTDLAHAFQRLGHHAQRMENALKDAYEVSLAGGAAVDLPLELAQFREAHGIVLHDVIRTAASAGRHGAAETKPPKQGSVVRRMVSAGQAVMNTIGSPHKPARLDGGGANADGGRGGAGAGGLTDARAVEVQPPAWVSANIQEEVLAREHLSPHEKRLAVRMAALLLAYAVLDPEIGYCQGMSDIALPFVQHIEDDVQAFWCFQRVMLRARDNFRIDDMGFRRSLSAVGRILSECDPVLHHKLGQLGAQDCMFAFRMVVVMMRRELPLSGCLRIWEAAWTEDQINAIQSAKMRQPREGAGMSYGALQHMLSIHRSASKLPASAMADATPRALGETPRDPAASVGGLSVPRGSPPPQPGSSSRPATARAASVEARDGGGRPRVRASIEGGDPLSAEAAAREAGDAASAPSAGPSPLQSARSDLSFGWLARQPQRMTVGDPGEWDRELDGLLEFDLLAFVVAAAVRHMRRRILDECKCVDDVAAMFAMPEGRGPSWDASSLLRDARRLQSRFMARVGAGASATVRASLEGAMQPSVAMGDPIGPVHAAAARQL
ncbi:unnamed protein product [Pedinophyceae sp. YPF-701]|nr:unnamed protein product [Pedinophyceae sp. YPF-701]